MAVIQLRDPLKRLADGRAEHTIEGATVADVLSELEGSYPPLAGWILDERGRIRPHINVFVNGERGDEDTAVQDADKVHVLPAVSGG
ncbi:MAG: MoaD/ThiS family protein [Actinomycetota bacterium]|nr:MoaD/ThiS family protein [Actinomycetota bacterium]